MLTTKLTQMMAKVVVILFGQSLMTMEHHCPRTRVLKKISSQTRKQSAANKLYELVQRQRSQQILRIFST